MQTTEYLSRSPQDPDDVLVAAPLVEPATVVDVVERAREAQGQWSALPAPARANALNRAAERLDEASMEIVELGIREVGKPRTEMVAEVARGVAILRYYAQQVLDPDGATFPPSDGRSLLVARRRPHGVVGLITPWNFPVAIPLWKAAPALAYGNAVVLKPARQALATALRVGQLVFEGLPDGLFNVIAAGSAAAEALIGSVDAISFTGSVDVGRGVVARASSYGIPVQAEMGGQNPSIILEDADLGRAADAVASAAMSYAGQKCTATSRVIVVGDPAAFTDALVTSVEKLPFGDPGEASTVVGPVIDEGARQAVLEAASGARSAGGRIVTGGTAAGSKGWFVQPTLVEGISPDAELAQNEVFGPIAVLLPAPDVDQAVAIANGVAFGLSAAVFTTDLDRALAVSGRLAAGMVRVNAPTSGVDFYAPFGGIKGSSYGPREQGKAAREFYTWTQTVTVSPARG
ncbi:MAG TPA: aldehyde dehydrogenase family protein [Acidimicrobiales bacterium]|nr:aldehyde dehydrogenase family protein [Acidimicrobiales bacterium]